MCSILCVPAQYYYVHKVTGESTWERPGMLKALGLDGEVPEGWAVHTDDVGDVRTHAHPYNHRVCVRVCL